MRLLAIIAAVFMMLPVLAQDAPVNIDPVKQQELNEAGIQNWTPGMNRGQTAKISSITPRTGGTAPENTDTMIYDNGTLTALPIGFGLIFGNQFSEGVGGVALATITLNSFSFYFMEDSTPDTGLFFQISNPLNSSSISALVSANISGLANSGPSFSSPTLNVRSAAALGATNMYFDTFYLGGWCLNSATTLPIDNETLGLNDTFNTGNQKGYTASSGTGPVAFGNAQPFNAMLRANVTSPETVPVELMSFGVEEK
jgi:hypothetical protein